jgi:hypothetical protein
MLILFVSAYVVSREQSCSADNPEMCGEPISFHYEHTFIKKPLGLDLTKGKQIRRLKNSVSIQSQMELGDEVWTLNGRNVKQWSFEQLVQEVSLLPTPITMGFKRVTADHGRNQQDQQQTAPRNNNQEHGTGDQSRQHQEQQGTQLQNKMAGSYVSVSDASDNGIYLYHMAAADRPPLGSLVLLTGLPLTWQVLTHTTHTPR